MSSTRIPISVHVNDTTISAEVEPRLLLADFLRHEAGLTGTHIGCEHGVCGACTVSVDGRTARSCLTFTAQVDGRHVRTIESCASSTILTILQEEFHHAHALQCGFCTPGFLMTLEEFLAKGERPTDAQIMDALSGNLCRCTGYVNMVTAVRRAIERIFN